MIFLIYAGIIFILFGSYNIICYFMMLPTMKSGRNMLSVGSERKSSFWNTCTLMIAEYFVKRYELDWNRSEEMEQRLYEKGIYTKGTVYLIEKILYYFSGLLLILPVFLINKRISILLCLNWTMIRVRDIKVLFCIDTGVELKNKSRKLMMKLLPGAYFIGQILLFLYICLHKASHK